MKIVKYALVAAVGFALSACTISGPVDDGALNIGEASGGPKPNVFEVFFDPDQSEISETATKILYEAADSAKQSRVVGIKVSVHPGASGWDAYSQALSERRAAAVKAELVKDGVPASEVISVAIAHSQLSPTGDGVSEPQNRRTEVTLY